MNAYDVVEIIMSKYRENAIERSWHPVKVRIDQDTTIGFAKKSDPSIKIQSGSIFFIDVGTVKNGLEGDIGRTFVFGENHQAKNMINHCKQVFENTVMAWKRDQLSGERLYDFAKKQAEGRGLELNLSMDGHRLGSFPHGVHFKGSLCDIDFTPGPNLWILEIQVAHPKLNIGAFYEDLIK